MGYYDLMLTQLALELLYDSASSKWVLDDQNRLSKIELELARLQEWGLIVALIAGVIGVMAGILFSNF